MNRSLNKNEMLSWLRETDERRLEELWRVADAVRRDNVGDEVHLRGLIEISNHCVRRCAYCGINAENLRLRRYRMSEDEIMECVGQAVGFGYGTVVMQSGEDDAMASAWLEGLIRRIKAETPLAVTLSLGERPRKDLLAWRRAGADRYLLRFETSNRALYDSIHPPRRGRRSDRIAILRALLRMGYEIGSGVMIGLPGQTYEDLANDIETFRLLNLDMIGVGPYLPHPATVLGRQSSEFTAPQESQAPATETMTYKVVALSRIACPKANIPSTTALATLNKQSGRELGLMRGANIVMPNLTPPAYRLLYEIYPAKACVFETASECRACLHRRILSIGRRIGTGRGDSPKRTCADARMSA